MISTINPIEPKILPLVEAINQLGLFKTFSSCEGHYLTNDQYMDRKHADVRFDPLPATSLEQTEHFLTFLITEFNNEHSFCPIMLSAHKLYSPNNEYKSDFCFVIRFDPFDLFDKPMDKRTATDKAIKQATLIVQKYGEDILKN